MDCHASRWRSYSVIPGGPIDVVEMDAGWVELTHTTQRARTIRIAVRIGEDRIEKGLTESVVVDRMESGK